MKVLLGWLKLIGIGLLVLTFVSCCYYLDHVSQEHVPVCPECGDPVSVLFVGAPTVREKHICVFSYTGGVRQPNCVVCGAPARGCSE